MRFFLIFISLFIIPTIGYAHDKSEINEKINATYSHFINAFKQLNADLIQPVYNKNAIYIPEQKSDDLIIGSEDIDLIYQRFFNRIKHKNAKVSVGFRIISRDISSDRATDIGYYLIRFIPADHTEQPISEFSGKFLVISKPTKNGDWQWVTEMNNKAKPTFYFGADSKPGLFYTDTKPLKLIKK
ncbi:DUF4440 domain-containing protein [Shewanella sp. 202IG2-18]|uniref:DUF4440 domain-containing protein n=1 Tax=Parashewanella hymeniacidonis TaxID=2807618 RepID=UPI001961C919|nr:DUF4440 domain-containing protein [Parashewanella hymeniacidonis]MBM7070701.1 DUF4440 domain-containing protein [Parashewanella hymeniacidonis]